MQNANLHVLYLHSNRLMELPETIGDLTNLKVLTLHRNKLNLIPDSLAKLSNLNKLNLNRLHPSELCNLDLQKVQDL